MKSKKERSDLHGNRIYKGSKCIKAYYENGAALITEAEVNALMDLVIAKNVFATVNGNLTGKKDAKIVYTDTNTIEVA